MRAAILSFLTVFLIASPAVPQSADDKLIVPGVRIGKWALKMTIPELERMNGLATHTLVTAGQDPYIGSITDFTIYHWPSAGFAVVTYDQKRVETIIAGYHGTFVPHKTDKGIGVRGTRGDVLRAYGKPTAEVRMSRAYMDRMTIYDKIGIAFRIENDGSIFYVSIFRPGRAKSLWKF